MQARGKEVECALAERTAHIWTFRGGKLLRNQPYRVPEEALRALELSA